MMLIPIRFRYTFAIRLRLGTDYHFPQPHGIPRPWLDLRSIATTPPRARFASPRQIAFFPVRIRGRNMPQRPDARKQAETVHLLTRSWNHQFLAKMNRPR